MGDNTAGLTVRLAVFAAGNKAASYPHNLPPLNQGPGNHGTAALVIMPGHAGTRGFIRSSPRTLAKGNAGHIGIAG